MTIPIIIFHVGNQSYLQTVIQQAEQYGNKIILIGDNSNKHFCKNHVDYQQYQNLEFDKIYQHVSPNNVRFEKICFQRWFIINNVMKQQQIQKAFVCDSDVMIYCNIHELIQKNYVDDIFISTTTTKYHVTAGQSIWTQSKLQEFCDFIIDFYQNNQWNYIHNYWKLYENKDSGGISDMYVLYCFLTNSYFVDIKFKLPVDRLSKSMDLSQIVNKCFFDNSIDLDQDAFGITQWQQEFYNFNVSNMHNYKKKISFNDNLPYCINLKDNQQYQLNAIHFHGCKSLIPKHKTYSQNISNKISNNINNVSGILVSVIIPTYNRFQYLLNSIKSIQQQTHQNIEIIVINDCSTQQEYYNHNWGNIKMIHLEKNTKEHFGFACAGYVRNQGMKIAKGKYIAFCDDDDIWFPKKIELQLQAMKKHKCEMSCSESLIGKGMYDSKKKYPKSITEYFFNLIINIHKKNGSYLLDNGYPDIWTLDLIKIANLCCSSSVVISKKILETINFMKHVPNAQEDYDCWLRALQHTNCAFIKEPCVYYDRGHGDGQSWWENREKNIQEKKTIKHDKSPTVSAVLFSLNDNYTNDMKERFIICINYMIECVDEIIYIDWGSPDNISLFELEYIRKNISDLSKIKHLKFTREQIQIIVPKDKHFIQQSIIRNIGIRAATSDYIISTNVDIIFPTRKDLQQILEKDDQRTFYTMNRVDIDIKFVVALYNNTKDQLRNVLSHYTQYRGLQKDLQPVEFFKESSQTQLDPNSEAYRQHCRYSGIWNCGDFQMAHRDIWHTIKGFEEKMLDSAFGGDSNIQKKACNYGYSLTVLTRPFVFHMSHPARSAHNNKKTNDMNRFFLQFDKSENTDDWGIVKKNYKDIIQISNNKSISNLTNRINDPQLDTMKQIVEKNPKDANNQLAIALFIYNKHDSHKEECLEYCNRAIEYAEKHKKNSGLFQNCALLYYYYHEFKSALQCFEVSYQYQKKSYYKHQNK